MSFFNFKKISTTGKGFAAALACAASLGSPAAYSQETLTENTQTTHDGFFVSFWKDSGDASMTLQPNGRYTSRWNNSTNNWVGGKGWNPGGRRVVHYEGEYNIDNSQNSYLALYGWTRDPLVEYYVIESYGSYNPSQCTEGRQTFGTYQSDGATYEIIRCQRIQQPSIDGTQTFDQYFSVRQPKKPFGQISGTITVGNHFDAWASAGLYLGDHDYMIMASEGYQSSGSTDITVSELSGGGDTGGGNTGGDNTGGGSDGGSSGSGDNTLVIRAVGTSGSEQLRVNVGGTTVETLNLSTSWQDFTVNTDATGDVNLEMFNDQGEGYEIQVEYVMINGETRYAEDQSYNTSAWDGECGGGSNTQWMHCDGMIGFGEFGGDNNTGGGNTGGGSEDGDSSSSGENELVIRAVGTSGSEHLRVNVGGNTIETLDLSTNWQNFTVNTNASGDVNVELFNDQGEGYEIQVEYVQVNGDTRYAEDQSYNTSAWDGECGGGSNTQWMHCDGMIGFGDIDGSGSTAPTGTTDSGSSNDSDATSGSDCVCDWYGSTLASCENQDSGWGWENNQSCIGNNTCNDQSGGGGVVCN